MHLLGDVGQVEIGDKGAHQASGITHIERIEQGGGAGSVLAASGPDLLDEIEHLGPIDPHQGIAEHPHDPADVTAQGAVVDRRLVHRVSMPPAAGLAPRSVRRPSSLLSGNNATPLKC